MPSWMDMPVAASVATGSSAGSSAGAIGSSLISTGSSAAAIGSSANAEDGGSPNMIARYEAISIPTSLNADV